MSRNDYNKYVQSGFYMATDYASSDIDPSGDTIGQIEGVDELDDSEDDTVTLLEMHVYEIFDGIDDVEYDEDEVKVAIPYVVTIDYNNDNIVSIRRNWAEDDERMERRNWFVSYKFLPGLGFTALVYIILLVVWAKQQLAH